MLSSYQPLLTVTSPILLNTNVLSLDPTVSYTTNGLTTTNDILMTSGTQAHITASSPILLNTNVLSLDPSVSYTTAGLTTTNDILMTSGSQASIRASSAALSLFSNSISLNANTTGSNGCFLTLSSTGLVMFGTNDPINTYIDLTLSSAISSRKIRLDSASTA